MKLNANKGRRRGPDEFCFSGHSPDNYFTTKDGLRRCRECQRQLNFTRRTKNPKAFILYRLRQNATRRGFAFNLKETDLPEIPEFCPVFPWIRLVYTVGAGRQDGSLSVDRISSNRGYIKENIRFISDRANILKSDASDQELIALGEDAKKRALDKESPSSERKPRQYGPQGRPRFADHF